MRRSFLPREIFLQALRVGAVSFLLLHNHPSGDVTPSPEDKELTKRLAMLGGMMQLCLTDHIIVGDFGFFQFPAGRADLRKENNMVPNCAYGIDLGTSNIKIYSLFRRFSHDGKEYDRHRKIKRTYLPTVIPLMNV